MIRTLAAALLIASPAFAQAAVTKAQADAALNAVNQVLTQMNTSIVLSDGARQEAIDKATEANGYKLDCTDPEFLALGQACYADGQSAMTEGNIDANLAEVYFQLGSSMVTLGSQHYNQGDYAAAVVAWTYAADDFANAKGRCDDAVSDFENAWGHYQDALDNWAIGSTGGGM